MSRSSGFLRFDLTARSHLAFAFLLSALLLTACGGGGGGGTNSSQSAMSTTSATDLSMSISQTSAHVGDTVTMTWSSTNATSCTASGAWTGARATTGSLTLSTAQTGRSTYELTCSGAGASIQDSVTLTVTLAPILVKLPGMPAPVPVSAGPCVAGSDANFQYLCISDEKSIPGTFATVSSISSSQAILAAGSSTPTTKTGGSCSAGFSSIASTFSASTPFGNDALAFVGAYITEVVYSSSYLASIGITGTLNALVIGDSSNTDHFEVFFYSPSSSENNAAAGTISLSNGALAAYSVVECLNATTSQPPTGGALSCSGHSGSGTNGISFPTAQEMSKQTWQISNTTAGQSNTTDMLWGVSYADPNKTDTSYTGSLRVTLWALSYDFSGGSYTGYRIATAYPNFTVGPRPQAYSSNQIYNNTYWPNINSSVTGTNPPAGSYCSVLFIEQYSSQCTTSDHYCFEDFREGNSVWTFK